MSDLTGVVAVIDELIAVPVVECHDDALFVEKAKLMRDSVAELIAAVVENRDATQAFANDGMPENWIRYQNSEDRLNAALQACKGGA